MSKGQYIRDLESMAISDEMLRTNILHFSTSSKLSTHLVVMDSGNSYVVEFHDDMQASVQNDGKFPEPFQMTDGVNTIQHDELCLAHGCFSGQRYWLFPSGTTEKVANQN